MSRPTLPILLGILLAGCSPQPAPAADSAEPVPPGVVDPCTAGGDDQACADQARAAIHAGDGKTARRLAKVGCDRGHADSCGLLGVTLADGLGGAVDMEAGLQLLRKGCAEDHAASCSDLGSILMERPVGSASDAEAYAALHKACGADDARACSNFVEPALAGRGGPADPHRAVNAGQKACFDLDWGPGCMNLGIVYYSGGDLKKQPDLAFKTWARGCRLGALDACKNVLSGGTDAQRAEARPLACALGHTEACEDGQ